MVKLMMFDVGPDTTPEQFDRVLLSIKEACNRRSIDTTSEKDPGSNPEAIFKEVVQEYSDKTKMSFTIDSSHIQEQVAGGSSQTEAEPQWTTRLAQVEQRTSIEKQAAELISSIEDLGADVRLTTAQMYVDKALRTLGAWKDAGEPGSKISADKDFIQSSIQKAKNSVSEL